MRAPYSRSRIYLYQTVRALWRCAAFLLALAVVGYTYWYYFIRAATYSDQRTNVYLYAGLFCLLVIAVWKTRVYQILTRPGFCGTLLEKRYKTEFVNEFGASQSFETQATVTLILRDEKGKRHRRKFRRNTENFAYYRIGDRLRFFWQVDYPLNEDDRSGDLICPFCGAFSRAHRRRCGLCRRALRRALPSHKEEARG